MVVLIGLVFSLIGKDGVFGQDITTGSSGEPNQSTTPLDSSGLTPALLKETITKQIEELEKSKILPPEHPTKNTVYLKADTTGTESFQPNQTKTINHHFYWTDPADIPTRAYFLQGYVRINLDPNIVEVTGVQPGLFDAWIRTRGPGYVIVEMWYFFYNVPPVNDPERVVFSVTFKGKQTGQTALGYDITDRYGNHRGWFWSGTAHYFVRVPVQIELLPLLQPPAAPSNLVATAVSSSRINLTWQDNSNNEEGFRIERKLTCYEPFTQIATVDADITNYSDTGLSPGTVYYYRVCAYNEVRI